MSTLSTYFLNEINKGYRPVLNEEIYTRKETKLIDAEFKIILDWFRKKENVIKVRRDKYDVDKHFAKQLNNIEKQLKSLFNANVIFKFDRASKFNKLSFGMCVYPSNEEMHYKVTEALKNEKGFYLYECNNSLVLIDFALITIIIENGLNERAMTAVLLHELGHKIYVLKQNRINTGIENSDDILNGTKDDINKNRISIIIGGMMCIPVTIFKSSNNKIISLTVSIISMVLGSSLIAYNFFRAEQKQEISKYVKSESLSDLIAVKYGYGYEIAKTMDIFYAMSKVSQNNKIKILDFFAKRKNRLDSSNLRRSEVKKALELELKDSNNNEITKKNIKKIISQIEEMESLNEGYEFDKTFCSTCETLCEKLTFRSVEMTRIKELLYSNKNLEKMNKLVNKGWRVVKTQNDLTPLQLKIVENKIREMAEGTITNTIEGETGTKRTKGHVSKSKTHLKLRNIVLMEVKGFLCIIDATDKGRIISATMMYISDMETLKFVKIQSSLFKF